MNAETPVIEIDHLVRSYGRTDAVNGLSLRVGAGGMLWVLRAQRGRPSQYAVDGSEREGMKLGRSS